MKPGWEWLLVLIIILLLFGAKRLPDTARSLGRSMRILKAETKGLHDDDEADDATPGSPAGSTSPTDPTQTQHAVALPPGGTGLVHPPASEAGAPPATARRSDEH